MTPLVNPRISRSRPFLRSTASDEKALLRTRVAELEGVIREVNLFFRLSHISLNANADEEQATSSLGSEVGIASYRDTHVTS